MMDIEKRAHDLAILYMQLEIKEGKIHTHTVSPQDDYKGFMNEYQSAYQIFKDLLGSP